MTPAAYILEKAEEGGSKKDRWLLRAGGEEGWMGRSWRVFKAVKTLRDAVIGTHHIFVPTRRMDNIKSEPRWKPWTFGGHGVSVEACDCEKCATLVRDISNGQPMHCGAWGYTGNLYALPSILLWT